MENQEGKEIRMRKLKMYKNKRFLEKNMIKGKKGIIDLLFLIVTVASIAIFFLVLRFVVISVADGMLSNEEINGTAVSVDALNYGKNLMDNFDYIFLVLFVGLILGTLVSSVLIDVHWVFVPVWIILFLATIVVGVILNNVYASFTETAMLAGTAATANTFTETIISNYVLIIIGVGVLSMVLIFGKTLGSRGGRL